MIPPLSQDENHWPGGVATAGPPPTEPPKRPVKAISCLVAALAMVVVVAGLTGFWMLLARVPQWVVTSPESHRGVGDVLAFLEVESLTDRSRLSLLDLQDQVVLLNFWGTWCPPCRAELPHIAELRRRFAGQKAFRLVAISYPMYGQRDDVPSLRENTQELLSKQNLDLPVYWDPDDLTRRAVDRAIGFEGYPTTVLLGRYGVIRAVWVGYRPGMETEIERYVDRVLGEDEN